MFIGKLERCFQGKPVSGARKREECYQLKRFHPIHCIQSRATREAKSCADTAELICPATFCLAHIAAVLYEILRASSCALRIYSFILLLRLSCYNVAFTGKADKTHTHTFILRPCTLFMDQVSHSFHSTHPLILISIANKCRGGWED